MIDFMAAAFAFYRRGFGYGSGQPGVRLWCRHGLAAGMGAHGTGGPACAGSCHRAAPKKTRQGLCPWGRGCLPGEGTSQSPARPRGGCAAPLQRPSVGRQIKPGARIGSVLPAGPVARQDKTRAPPFTKAGMPCTLFCSGLTAARGWYVHGARAPYFCRCRAQAGGLFALLILRFGKRRRAAQFSPLFCSCGNTGGCGASGASSSGASSGRILKSSRSLCHSETATRQPASATPASTTPYTSAEVL